LSAPGCTPKDLVKLQPDTPHVFATDAAHRRTIIVEAGKPWIAQRYAIDWVQYQTVGDVRTTWQGPEDRNESYLCYNQPIYSVAAGKIVSVVDGLPENVPHSAKMAIDINLDNAASNHIVVDIGQGNFVLYAHIRPATIQVKVGDTVTAGQVIGRVGNTGNSSEPHLHMHVVDRPSVLGGNGVPYAFPAYMASAPVELIEKPNSQAISFGPIGPETAFTNNYPADNAAVTFR
jgi:biotin carboxyl carrier protein